MDHALIIFLAWVFILSAIIFAIVCRNKGTKRLDVEYFRVKYLEIENKLNKVDVSTYHMPVIEADKLLDFALKESGYGGNTMSERMKKANKIFSDRNGVWQAHKLRNRIVHEPEIKTTYDEVRYAINCVKKALKDLKAI
ncbi:MAG TPA: hypothetical protein PLO25_00245 [Candidatus Saccharibacteria bacterium]|nr:hypothetical protein [Candidatus Saccharibacteria bacterium]